MTGAITERFRKLYGSDPEVIARAPGRIEFIGNHTDYNGGPVLGAAISREVWVALARRPGQARRFSSGEAGMIVSLPADRAERASGSASWTNYSVGMLAVFSEMGLAVPAGFDLLTLADLPIGAGLSSSAALELASGLAFLGASGQDLPRGELVRAARRAENEFVGVPVGILDQAVSGFGRAGHLVHIDCRGPSFSTVPVPPGCALWIFNTHTKHALSDGLYARRHGECLEAARVLGVPLLADATQERLESAKSRMSEAAYRRARHIVGECARVAETVRLLGSEDLAGVGRLLCESHASSRDWFENSTPELDFLAESLASAPGVHGARLSGGGFGGAVMALASAGFGASEAGRVASAYAARFKSDPLVLRAETADGASLVLGLDGS